MCFVAEQRGLPIKMRPARLIEYIEGELLQWGGVVVGGGAQSVHELGSPQSGQT